MSKSKLLISLFAGVFILIQFVPVDRAAPDDMGPIEISDARVAEIMDRACADCHTNQTRWPWYGYVAPASWFLSSHIAEGREHLNFSRWEDQSARRQASKLREVAEEVAEGSMPMPSYLILHRDAKLTDEEKQVLISWAEQMEAGMGRTRRAPATDDASAPEAEPSGASGEAEVDVSEATAAGLHHMVATAGRFSFTRRAARRPLVTRDVSFSADIMPIFEATCLECHGAPGDDGEPVLEAQLDLRTYEAILLGSEFGAVVEPGNPEESYLLESVEMGDMPEDGDPLTPEQIDLIRQWIIAGAPNN